MLLHLPPATAQSEESDYLPDSVSWNGLSDLRDLARASQHQLVLVESLDWSRLPGDATIFLVHPAWDLDPAPFIEFLTGGGRLLIADDFGSARPLLQALGVQRLDGTGIRAEHYHQGKAQLPVATGGPALHPLNQGIDSVLANHPSYFRSRLPTLAGFGEGQQLLVAGRVGKGLFVALADPSLLINAMLRFTGNRALGLNLLRYLAPQQGSPIFLLTGHSRTAGTPRRGQGEEGADGRTQRFMTEYNQFLEHLNSFAPPAHLLRVLTFALGCLSFLGLFILLPTPRKPLRGEWLRPVGSKRWSLEEQMASFASGPRGGRARYPASLLREELEERLNTLLRAPDPVFTMRPSWVFQQTRHLYGEEAAALIRQLLDAVRKIPPLSGDEGGHERGFSPRELTRLYLLSQQLLGKIDAAPAGDPEAPSPGARGNHRHAAQ